MEKIQRSQTHSQTNSSEFDCKDCGEIFKTKNEFALHEKNCSEGFTERETKECRYYKRGNCKKGADCKFKHSGARRCRNGPRCRYYAQGRCHFFHERSEANRVPTTSDYSGEFKYCMYGAECRNMPVCPLFHYSQDFPPFPMRRNPPIGARTAGRRPTFKRK